LLESCECELGALGWSDRQAHWRLHILSNRLD
jgi:hypothetical protein